MIITWCHAAAAKSLQLCPTLCDPPDYNPPGSSVHRILQARIPDWVATPFSRGRDWTHVSYIVWVVWVVWAGSLPLAPSGKPLYGAMLLSRFSYVWLCVPLVFFSSGSSVLLFSLLPLHLCLSPHPLTSLIILAYNLFPYFPCMPFILLMCVTLFRHTLL